MHAHAPIIAAFDPDSGARAPVEFGVAASRVTGAPLVLVVVHKGKHAGDGDGALDRLRQDLEGRDTAAEVRMVEGNTAAQGLERAMRDLEPELVVVGATRRSASGSMLVGTTAERVLHASRCPVAVVPQGYEAPAGGVSLVRLAIGPTPEGLAGQQVAA